MRLVRFEVQTRITEGRVSEPYPASECSEKDVAHSGASERTPSGTITGSVNHDPHHAEW
jgi:hypothetical protein